MTDSSVLDIGVQAILMATKLAAPILGVSLAIGLFIGLIQSATQLQEQTLTFVPKIAAMIVAAILLMPWISTKLLEYAAKIFSGG